MADDTNAEPIKEGLPKGAFAKSSDQVRVRTDRYRQQYANNMTISMSTWDLSVTFGEIIGEQDGKSVIEETAKIIMTREIAKVLATLLNNHIAIFESKFGEVKLPVIDAPPDEAKADAEPAEVLAEPEARI